MKRSASTADYLAPASGVLLEAAAAATSFFWRNPGVAGGSTAFAVAFLFVSANAVWYQEHRHPAPLFATRATGAPADFAERLPPRAADDAVAFVQQALTDMSLYTGSIDGVSGPRTREAVSAYRRKAGLDPEGGIDAALLARLKLRGEDTPLPSPAPRKARAVTSEPDEAVAFVQARLTALGYTGVDIDGLSGSRTRAAILDFQGKNGLPETGEVDEALLKALRRTPKA